MANAFHMLRGTVVQLHRAIALWLLCHGTICQACLFYHVLPEKSPAPPLKHQVEQLLFPAYNALLQLFLPQATYVVRVGRVGGVQPFTAALAQQVIGIPAAHSSLNASRAACHWPRRSRPALGSRCKARSTRWASRWRRRSCCHVPSLAGTRPTAWHLLCRSPPAGSCLISPTWLHSCCTCAAQSDVQMGGVTYASTRDGGAYPRIVAAGSNWLASSVHHHAELQLQVASSTAAACSSHPCGQVQSRGARASP